MRNPNVSRMLEFINSPNMQFSPFYKEQDLVAVELSFQKIAFELYYLFFPEFKESPEHVYIAKYLLDQLESLPQINKERCTNTALKFTRVVNFECDKKICLRKLNDDSIFLRVYWGNFVTQTLLPANECRNNYNIWPIEDFIEIMPKASEKLGK